MRFRYVTCFGAVWRLTNKSYSKMLLDVANGEQGNLNSYGRQLGEAHNVSDITPEEAVECLKDIGADLSKLKPQAECDNYEKGCQP